MKLIVALLFLSCAVVALAGVSREARHVHNEFGVLVAEEQAVRRAEELAVQEEKVLIADEIVQIDEAKLATEERLEKEAILQHAPRREIDNIREEIREDEHKEHAAVDFLEKVIIH